MLLEQLFWPLMFFIFGACFGSFANVVIYRLPRDESIAFPASHCYSCKKPIRWFHNIPIFAWFILRGRCASCGAGFSFRYPLVEFVMAALFVGVYYSTGLTWTTLEYLLFTFMVVTASVIDIDHMILPDKFTITGVVLGLLGAALNPERSFIDALTGACVGFFFLWAVAYLYWVFRGQEGMGGGDIKLLAWIGSLLGIVSIPIVILLSSVVGSIVGLAIMVRTKGGLRVAIPFGPYLAAGALAYILFDLARLGRWYLSLHGLSDL